MVVDAIKTIFQIAKVVPCGDENGESVILVLGMMIFLDLIKHYLNRVSDGFCKCLGGPGMTAVNDTCFHNF
jgi:hypothetical protein